MVRIDHFGQILVNLVKRLERGVLTIGFRDIPGLHASATGLTGVPMQEQSSQQVQNVSQLIRDIVAEQNTPPGIIAIDVKTPPFVLEPSLVRTVPQAHNEWYHGIDGNMSAVDAISRYGEGRLFTTAAARKHVSRRRWLINAIEDYSEKMGVARLQVTVALERIWNAKGCQALSTFSEDLHKGRIDTDFYRKLLNM